MSQHQNIDTKKVTIPRLKELKRSGTPIAMLTAYDYTMARLVDSMGVDMILVGDSAANVMAGHTTTLPITLDEMIYHGRCVMRGVSRAMVIVDMPFGSYQGSPDDAVRAAIRIMKETGADGVKLEGGKPVFEAVRRIVQAGIPVVGHLGLTPQSVHQLGGYGLQAKTTEAAEALLNDAEELKECGVFAMVVEKIPASLGAELRKIMDDAVVIGIGAGADVDGQVLVLQDMLGMEDNFQPKFLRRFGAVGDAIRTAVGDYVSAVKERSFPSEQESY